MSCVELNGRMLPLRYTLNALCLLEEKMGKGLDQLLSAGFSSLRGLLWCGLLSEMPALTLEEAGDMLEKHLKSGGKLLLVAASLSQALEDAGFFHPGEEAQEKNPPR